MGAAGERNIVYFPLCNSQEWSSDFPFAAQLRLDRLLLLSRHLSLSLTPPRCS